MVNSANLQARFKIKNFEGEIHTSSLYQIVYSTDASAYREIPQGVTYPKTDTDIQRLVEFAGQNRMGLIPRAGGTSLAGQVVGNGLIVDVSRYMREIIEFNEREKWVKVQPGIVRDELNRFLKEYNLFFAPETSTSNRATIGGMVGNNSCGSNSVKYGSTRDHLLEVEAVLADGSKTTFKSLSKEEFDKKCSGETAVSELEQNIYQQTKELLNNDQNRDKIKNRYPKPEIPRRNHGYALDLLMDCDVFEESDRPFNMCKMIAGSEGTLVFITSVKVALEPLPPKHEGLVCVHFHDLYNSLKATVLSLDFDPGAVELMDYHILERTKDNIQHRKNRFFVEGDPEAILVIQLFADSAEELKKKAEDLTIAFKEQKFGYHYPVVTGSDCKKVWNLRKAGLGLLSNVVGDSKPAPVIEDTAVDVRDLAQYIEDFNETLKKYELECVHYAHAGSGELHLRPVLNLKTARGQELFRTVLDEIAHLVKKYRGSLSGEHGDGRLRGEFIPFMVGEEIYDWFVKIKKTWDQDGVFNPNKIVDTPPMNEQLRYEKNQQTKDFETIFDFSHYEGYQRSAELCNGSGDCRKSQLAGGTMCPTYMATGDELQTTRARANTLREVLTRDEKPFENNDVRAVMDTCIGCKGCKSECPSNVDLTRLKAEFDYQYGKQNGVAFQTRVIGSFAKLMKLASKFPGIANYFIKNEFFGSIGKSALGFAKDRSLPEVSKVTLTKWYRKNYQPPQIPIKKVWLFVDEFTEYNEAHIGIAAVELLLKLGYDIRVIDHPESGRSYFSKGLLKQAKAIARKNVSIFSPKVSEDEPLIGIEPSAILSFRDEYPDIVGSDQAEKAKKLSKNAFLIDEFLASEIEKGNIKSDQFRSEPKTIHLHGHCHQKALSSLSDTKKILQFAGYKVLTIPSGCCGMAGSYGYLKQNFDTSMKIGEMVLFPRVRSASKDDIIAANGTSCRHQIKDGVQVKALHPVEIMRDALSF